MHLRYYIKYIFIANTTKFYTVLFHIVIAYIVFVVIRVLFLYFNFYIYNNILYYKITCVEKADKTFIKDTCGDIRSNIYILLTYREYFIYLL